MLHDDSAYSHFPIHEVAYTSDCTVAGAAGLETFAGYDAGLGVVSYVEDMTGQRSLVSYDQFGRLTALYRPKPDGSAIDSSTLPSVKISYDLPTPGDGRAYSVIHTESQDAANLDSADYLESYSFVDGMGRARVGLSEADPDEDAARWVVSSIAEFDAKGAVRRKYLPFFFDGEQPVGFPVGDAPPDTQYGRQRYDAFGRQLQTFDVDGTVTLQSRYHALSSDLYDAADLSPGPHQGSYATTRSDGHGRTVATTERIHVGGALEAREVRTTYLPTGEPLTITRVRVDKETTSPPVMRWMRYDSLGRMVVNADPHATVFTGTFPGPASYNDNLKTWRYVYDDAGDLVGTSDARGCGQNFTYDVAGRLLTEDYSPCVSTQALYTAPQANSDGFEVFYQYDTIPSDFPRNIGTPSNYGTGSGQYSTSSPTLRGRLAAVHDRGASTWFQYDARGRVVQTARKIARNLPSVSIIGDRYSARWYYKNTTFDAADRPVSETTGATQLLGTDGNSAVTTEYTKRGTVKKVGSSYGPLVNKIERDAEGKVNEVTYGDVAKTKTHSSYDTRRRLRSVQTYRGPPQLWSTTPAAYTPTPTPDAAVPTTFQPLLEDLDYGYDVVNNPVEIRDWRTPEDWPKGSQPVTRRFEYDDLYRVTRADYEYPGGTDIAVSPYAAEMSGKTDSRRPPLVGHKLLANRPLWQTYNYDWLGNTSSTDDDAHAFYDRSLGTVTQGTAAKPYQLTGAIQSTVPNNGSITTVAYDEAGNLLTMKVNRTATTCDLPGKCTLHSMRYEWDEVGRLAQAYHIEGAAGTNPVFQYLYDYNDERVVRDNATTATRKQTLYIFDSLEIRGTELQGSPSEYLLTTANEVPILAAHGMRLGRIVKEPDAGNASFKGEPQLSLGGTLPASLHLFLELADHLGSTSIVIDQATSELVEARTYQPYGATESDYRPERWKGFREDYGFTGKEEDVEVGLQYFGKRYLSPYLGRWISADPLAVHSAGSADLNLYAYVQGAVLRAVDPLGLDAVTDQHAIEQAMFDQSHGQLGVDHRYTPAPAPRAAPSGDGGGAGAPAVDAKMANAAARGQSGTGELPHDQGNGELAAAKVVASAVPLAGEAMDVDTVIDPESSAFDKTMAAGSLFLNVLTLGVAPNYSAFRFADGLAETGSREIKVYHGTSAERAASIDAHGIDLSKGSPRSDFGRGFYTTPDLAQAKEWAAKRFGEKGVVMEFTLNLDKLGNVRSFEAGDEALTSLVASHRSGAAGSPVAHGFDAVAGPMLKNPGAFVAGAEPVWRGTQISFHTEAGLNALKFEGSF